MLVRTPEMADSVERLASSFIEKSRTMFRHYTHARSDVFVGNTEQRSLFAVFSSFASLLFYAAPDSTMVRVKEEKKMLTEKKSQSHILK